MKEERTVKVTGELILSSKETEELVDRLTKDGILFEYISGLLDERAKGIMASDIAEILKLLKEKETKGIVGADALAMVLREIQELRKLLQSIGNMGVQVAAGTSTPISHMGKADPPKPEAKLEKVTIDSTKIKGGSSGLLSSMKKMNKKAKQ